MPGQIAVRVRPLKALLNHPRYALEVGGTLAGRNLHTFRSGKRSPHRNNQNGMEVGRSAPSFKLNNA